MTRTTLFAIVAACAALLTSCLKSPAFRCDEHGADSCGAGATCEATGYCSVPDSGCGETGRRYADSAGAFAGHCVGDFDAGLPDASYDILDPPPVPASWTCVTGPAHPEADDPCAASVCERAPGCCQGMWTHECVLLSETVCERSCSNAVSTGSLNSVGVGVLDSSWHAVLSRVTTDWVGIAWGDFDGDGDMDLAYSEQCAVQVLRNQGVRDGLLEVETATTITPPSCTGQKLAWGDFDGDGDLDLVHGSDKGMSVYLNQDGSFDDAVEVLDDTHVISQMAFADYNQDGKADLVVGLWDAEAVLFRHAGTSQERVTAWTGPAPSRRVAWCHLGGAQPAGPALITIGPFDLLSLYPNTGSPSPTARFSVDTPGELQDIACADLDGDGTAEIVSLSAYENPDNTGHVRIHSIVDGAVVWTSPTAYNSGHLDLGDISGDGLLDIVIDTDPPGSDIAVPEPFRVFRQTADAGWTFADEVGGDWGAGDDTSDLQVVHLGLD